MRIERAVTVNVEAAHCDGAGRMHGHSYLIECWSHSEWDLPCLKAAMQVIAECVDHTVLEASIGGSTMESLGAWFMERGEGYQLSRVVVRRPTLGYTVEVRP